MSGESIKERSGSCHCGKVVIKAKAVSSHVGVCHCETCRTWSAGPFFSVDCGQAVEIEGRESLGIYESSEWAHRGFCCDCGSNLFYFLKPAAQYIVSSEIFKNADFIFDHEVFVDEKPRYYDFSNQTKKMTGAEVFAAFSGS